MNAPLPCADVRARLPLFVGRDLDPAESAGLEEHLAGCGSCAGELARAERARAALLRLREDAPLEIGLWPGVRAGLRAERAASAAGRDRAAASGRSAAGPRLVVARRFAGLAAAAGLLALFALDRSPQPVAPTIERSVSSSADPLPAVAVVAPAAPAANDLALAPARGGLVPVDFDPSERLPVLGESTHSIYWPLHRGAATHEVSTASYGVPFIR